MLISSVFPGAAHGPGILHTEGIRALVDGIRAVCTALWHAFLWLIPHIGVLLRATFRTSREFCLIHGIHPALAIAIAGAVTLII